MAHKLRNLKVKRVDLVDKGANQGADVVLFKRHDGPGVIKDAIDFDDALFARRLSGVTSKLADSFFALVESIDSLAHDTPKDLKNAVKSRVSDFVGHVKASIPDLIAEATKRQGDNTMKFDKSKLTGDALTAFEVLETANADLVTANDALKVDVKKLTPTEPDPEKGSKEEYAKALATMTPEARMVVEKLQANTEAANERAEKADKKAADAETVAQAEKRARILKACEEGLGDNFKALSLDPQKDAAIFVKLRESDPEGMKRIEAILTGANSVIATGGIYTEKGSPQGGAPDSAKAIVEQRMSELLAKNDKLDAAAAMKRVFKADRALYDRYREETNVRV